MRPLEPRTIREPKETTVVRRVKPAFQKPIRLFGYTSPRRPVSKHTLHTTPKTPAGAPTEIATTIPEPASVNSTLSFHPLAEIFPLLDDERLRALANDIAARGLLDEIALYEGKILDGRCRYLACLRAGAAPRFRNYLGDDPLGFVIGRNVHRRHLTKIQRALAAARAATLPVGSNQTTPGLPIGRAAEIFEVSARNIARAKAILRNGTLELVQAVETRKVAIFRAAKLVELSPEAQIAALRKLAKGKRNPRKKAPAKVPKEDIKFDQSDGARAPERSPSGDRSSEPPGVHDGRRDPKDTGQANEAAYARLMAAWSQASNSVRIRFIEELMRE